MFNTSALNIYPFIHYKFNKMAFWFVSSLHRGRPCKAYDEHLLNRGNNILQAVV